MWYNVPVVYFGGRSSQQNKEHEGEETGGEMLRTIGIYIHEGIVQPLSD